MTRLVKGGEAGFQQQVIDLARFCGIPKHYHQMYAIGSDPGWPDLVLPKPPRLIIAELKRENGKATERQQEWLDTLAACKSIEVYLWRPSDMEEIETVFRKQPAHRAGEGGD